MYGSTVKYIRMKRKMTLRVAAKRLGISHAHLCNIENDHSGMSLQLMDKINVVMGTNIAALYLVLFDPEVPDKLKRDLEAWLEQK